MSKGSWAVTAAYSFQLRDRGLGGHVFLPVVCEKAGGGREVDLARVAHVPDVLDQVEVILVTMTWKQVNNDVLK